MCICTFRIPTQTFPVNSRLACPAPYLTSPTGCLIYPSKFKPTIINSMPAPVFSPMSFDVIFIPHSSFSYSPHSPIRKICLLCLQNIFQTQSLFITSGISHHLVSLLYCNGFLTCLPVPSFDILHLFSILNTTQLKTVYSAQRQNFTTICEALPNGVLYPPTNHYLPLSPGRYFQLTPPTYLI